MELAELGYDSKRRFKPQVNLLYVYRLSSDASARMYYKQFLGSPPPLTSVRLPTYSTNAHLQQEVHVDRR